RDDRIAAGEPAPREEEQPGEKQRYARFGQANRRTLSTIDRGHDLEIALEPDAEETDEREAQHRRRKRLRFHAQQPDKRDQEDAEEHRDPDRPPRPRQTVKDEIRLLRQIPVPDDEELRPQQICPEHGEAETELAEVMLLANSVDAGEAHGAAKRDREH